MTFSEEETRFFRSRIAAKLGSQRTSAWQRKFLTDVAEKFDRYGRDTRLSDKQVIKLREIVGAYRPSTLSITGDSQLARGRTKSRSGGLLLRKGRRLGSRFMRDLAMLAVLALGFVVYSLFRSNDLPPLMLAQDQHFGRAPISTATFP